MGKVSETEAMKVYVLPEKGGRYSWRVEPPASLRERATELPYYGEHGFWLKNWEQLRYWIEEVSRLKLQG